MPRTFPAATASSRPEAARSSRTSWPRSTATARRSVSPAARRRSPTRVRDLYAAAAGEWPSRHQALVPASESDLVDAFFRLAFGCQFMLAVRETEPADARRFRRRDPRDDAGGSPDAGRARARPVGSPARVAELLRDPSDPAVGARGGLGRPVGRRGHRVGRGSPSATAAPSAGSCCTAARRATCAFPRRTSISRSPPRTPTSAGPASASRSTAHALAWAHDQGFRSMTADWRSVNLLASRFWPRRGWRPTHFRLYRAVP